MRIKLINPPASGVDSMSEVLCLPYSLGVLRSFLRKNNVHVDLQDLNAELQSILPRSRLSRLLGELEKFQQYQTHLGYYPGIGDRRNNELANFLINSLDLNGYGVVGIGIYSRAQALLSLLLVEKIKKEFNVPVVIGGPYVTSYINLFFQKYNFIDYAIVGEGEVPLLEFIRYLEGKSEIQDVPSLCYKNNGQTFFNRRTFYHVEEQSCPDFDGLVLERYQKDMSRSRVLPMPYCTSRGCLYKCTFCSYTSVDGPWQIKSTGKVICDITRLKSQYKSNFFTFRDATFNMSYKHVDTLCDELIRNKLDIQWSARVKGTNIDERLITKMKEAGCYMFSWGIESGSNRILRLMKKETDINQMVPMLKMAKAKGIKNYINLIVDYPYETCQDLEESAVFLKNNAGIIDGVHVYQLQIFPGSFLFNNAEEVKIKIKENRDTFFTYAYGYEETDKDCSVRDRNVLTRLRIKIKSYNYRFIHFKRMEFPYNIIVKFMGMIIPRIHWLLKNDSMKKLFGRLFFLKLFQRNTVI